MNDENYPQSGPHVPRPDGSEGESFFSSQHPTPAEDTRPIPPYQQPASAVATAPARRGGLTAAVLVGALVLGGAAGVGGAAWYDAWQDNPSDSATSSSAGDSGGQIQASTGGNKPNGTVESVASKVLPAVVKISVTGQQAEGSGSGIVLTKDGEILTNNHVVELAANGGDISVNFNDGKSAKAKVIGTDPVTDIAVIKAEGVSGLTAATLGKSSALSVGQAVVAVGSPYGLNATVTSGIVSALNRPVSTSSDEGTTPQLPGFPGQEQTPQSGADLSTTYPAIQTDAAINPGNSGGPLVDMSGRVVGINSSIRTGGSSGVSTDSGGSIGLGFAIPIDEVLPVVNQLVDKQTPTHARLGATVSDVTGNSLQQGALIKSLDTKGAGKAAGLQAGDVITKVDDQVIDGSESLVATVRGHRPGDSVTLTYIRDGKTKTVTIDLGSDKDAPSS